MEHLYVHSAFYYIKQGYSGTSFRNGSKTLPTYDRPLLNTALVKVSFLQQIKENFGEFAYSLSFNL